MGSFDTNYWSEQFQKWFFPGFTGNINIGSFLTKKKALLENEKFAMAEKKRQENKR